MFRFEDDLRPKPLSDETRILLYQAVRELMINVARHAKARNVKVSIQRDYKNMQIDVEDDGIGVDTTKIDPLCKSDRQLRPLYDPRAFKVSGRPLQVLIKAGPRHKSNHHRPLKHSSRKA